MILGLPFARYRFRPIFDTMREWSKWGSKMIKLGDLAGAMGIESPKGELDGSKVEEYFRAARLDEILAYCDVRAGGRRGGAPDRPLALVDKKRAVKSKWTRPLKGRFLTRDTFRTFEKCSQQRL